MEKTDLCRELARQIGAGESAVVPRLFETLVDEREARLLLAAAPPATAGELAERTGMAAAEVEALAGALFGKGLLFKSRKPDGTRYYRVRHILQLHDATAVMDAPPPEMLSLWKDYMATEWDAQSRTLESVLPGPAVRVVPINVSVEPRSQVLAFDDVSTLIHQARNIAVTRCSCRVIDGACGQPLDVCIQLDRAADYAIERGTGRRLDRDEALRLLETCEQQGLVHVAENKRGTGNVICNCCRDCCLNWASVRTGLGKFVAPSRLRAVVDAEGCNGCGLCVERCFFDAMAMSGGEPVAAADEGRCMGCGICRVVCPTDAIGMEVVRPQEFVPA